jgi:hypothetical protein
MSTSHLTSPKPVLLTEELISEGVQTGLPRQTRLGMIHSVVHPMDRDFIRFAHGKFDSYMLCKHRNRMDS